MLLQVIPVRDDRTNTIGGAYVNDNILAHGQDPHPTIARDPTIDG
jgi:hypothetical protein